MDSFDLKGRVAVVTGGNGGIGLGMARGLARAGAAVVVAARDHEKNRRAAGELSALGVEAVQVEVDVAEEASVQAMVRAVTDRFGRLDILVNNAGINIRKPPQDYTIAEWRQVIDVNLTSAFLTSRETYPTMKRQGGGKIINIGSMMSIFGASFAGAYGSSKGGIVQFTRGARRPGRGTTSRSTPCCRGGSTLTSPRVRAARWRGSTTACSPVPRRGGGASSTTWGASPCSWPARRPTS